MFNIRLAFSFRDMVLGEYNIYDPYRRVTLPTSSSDPCTSVPLSLANQRRVSTFEFASLLVLTTDYFVFRYLYTTL